MLSLIYNISTIAYILLGAKTQNTLKAFIESSSYQSKIDFYLLTVVNTTVVAIMVHRLKQSVWVYRVVSVANPLTTSG